MREHSWLPTRSSLSEQLKLQSITIPDTRIREIEGQLAVACGGKSAISSYLDGASVEVSDGQTTLIVHLNFGCPDGQPSDVTSEERFLL